jgi:3-deoxy-D-manno-octulosonic-acid transferase
MRILYTLAIYLYLFAIRIVSVYNPKARKWLTGRRNLFETLTNEMTGASHVIWFHCASLGEFEQGRPLIDKIRKAFPNRFIVLTFYSPSGYEMRRNYPGVNRVFYLPLDTPANARRFLDIVKPEAVFFIKYEFWFNMLTEIGNRKIPAFLVSGVFRKEQLFFKSYGAWFRSRLRVFSRFYLQDTHSVELLRQMNIYTGMLSGDTRFDRVREIAAEAKEIPLVEIFVGTSPCLIVGSAWPEDEGLLSNIDWKQKGYKVLIAPHEIEEEHIQTTIRLFGNYSVQRYSLASSQTLGSADVLIVDNVGMLSSLYRYGTIAFIGGGFGDGIHNILEAAVFGLPVLFGPNYTKFSEAIELVAAGGAFCVSTSGELEKTISLLLGEEGVLSIASEVARHYVSQKSGATALILADPLLASII